MKYKVEIWISFNYGAQSLVFSKTMILPFIPFFGLWITEKQNGVENVIKLENDDYTTSIIDYNVNEDLVYINCRNFWKYQVSDETIDNTLEAYLKTDWERNDSTDINVLKSLMKK